ncbi:hypothetical protein ACFCP7_27580 [Paenibacillus elgii]
MKKKEILGLTEVLSGLVQAGAAADEIIKTIRSQNLHKNKDFVMLFRTIRAWIESDNPEIKLTNPEKALLFTVLPYVNWNNQIELLQEDIQSLCGYKSRQHFSELLNSLAKKNVLHRVQVGKQNYWFLNPLLVKKGNDSGEPKYIKFDLKN